MSLSAKYSKWDNFGKDIEDSDDSDDDFFSAAAKRKSSSSSAAASTSTTKPAPAVSDTAVLTTLRTYENLPTLIQESCASVMESATDVKMDDEALIAFADSLDIPELKASSAAEKLCLPFKFDREELANFISLCKFLNFGSGWVDEIKTATGKHPLHESTTSIFEHILYGLIGAVMSGSKLTAEYLGAMSQFQFAKLLELPLTKEVAIQGPLKKDVPSDERPLIDQYFKALQQTCRVLRERNFETLGEFALSDSSNGLVPGREGGDLRTVDILFRRFAGAFEIIRDEADHAGTRIYFYSKLSTLLYSLHLTLEGGYVSDLKNIPPPSSAVAISILVQKNILKLSPALSEKINSNEDLPSLSQSEIELRAGCVTAIFKISKYLSEKHAKEIFPIEIGSHLEALGRRNFDEIKIHKCKSTIHY